MSDTALQSPLPAVPDETVSQDMRALMRMALRRGIIVVIIIVCVIVAIAYTPVEAYMKNVHDAQEFLDATGAWAPLIFGVAVCILTGIGISRLLLCFLTGMLFGVLVGLPLVLGATLLGAYIGFLVVRWTHAHRILHAVTQRSWVRFLMAEHTIFSLAFIRQIPISGVVINTYLGATSVSHRTFLLGTLLGYLPSTVICVFFGSGVGISYDEETLAVTQLTIAAAAALLTLFLLYITGRWYIMRLRRSVASPDAAVSCASP